jgi:hypothetical protein
MPPPPPSLGLGLGLARPLVPTSGPAPAAVWQVFIEPDSPVYNHPGESETPKIALPGGTHILKIVIDQISPNWTGEYLTSGLYDADFNPSPRVANLIELLDEVGLAIGEDTTASQSDFAIESSDTIALPRFLATFEIEVLVSSMPLGLYVFSPDPTHPDPFTFRVSLYVLSSTPAP